MAPAGARRASARMFGAGSSVPTSLTLAWRAGAEVTNSANRSLGGWSRQHRSGQPLRRRLGERSDGFPVGSAWLEHATSATSTLREDIRPHPPDAIASANTLN